MTDLKDARPDTAETASRSNRTRWMVLLAVLALALTLPLARFLGTYNYILQVGIVVFMWIALTSSWNILGGYTGYISLGHNVFFGVGAYVSGILLVYNDLSPFVTAPLAGLVALLLGVLAGLITFRTKGPAFIVATIALLLVVFILMDNWEFIGASNGLSLPLPPFPVEWVKVPFYYAMLLTAILSVMLGHRVAHSKMGLALRAIAEDETKAEVAGINTRLFKLMAFALSAFFPGVAGAIWGYSLAYLRPTAFFLISVAAQMVLMAIIGGRGTVAGPVVGAVFLVALNEFSITYFGASEINLTITGVVMVLALLFFPLGLVGTLRENGRLPVWLDWD
ncbi:MAG TPA: branched-chain amino acid ABC transporter permease [Acidimicrobiia bacterium]|nr:branched-chain amino acid ABC transporter permease [Acidimicrobiia bacterium]